MSRPFDTNLWVRQGAWYEPEMVLRPFAEHANRVQYMPWLVSGSWLSRLRAFRLP